MMIYVISYVMLYVCHQKLFHYIIIKYECVSAYVCVSHIWRTCQLLELQTDENKMRIEGHNV